MFRKFSVLVCLGVVTLLSACSTVAPVSTVGSDHKDFYYSQSQAYHLIKYNFGCMHMIDNKPFTEVVRSGNKPSGNWNDYQLIEGGVDYNEAVSKKRIKYYECF